MATTKLLKSTHGRQLLNLLSDWTVVSHDPRSNRPSPHLKIEEQVREIIEKDPLACRLADSETGNNAFHLLVSKSRLSSDILIQFLQLLATPGSEGLKKTNKDGDLPIHLYLLQGVVSADVVQCLINLAPTTASVCNGQRLIPLFLCTMRDDISAEVVKILCKAHPAGPSTCNSTNSLPLHFAAKKLRPNKEILKILLRRHPEGASRINDHSLLPLHCAASFSDDLDSVKMIFEAYPEGILQPDRQGRLPLHLAVLAVGNSHTQAIQAESEESQLQLRMEQMSLKDSSNGAISAAAVDDDNFDDDYDDDDDTQKKRNQTKSTAPAAPLWPLQEVGQRSRRVVHFLARACPVTLCIRNNFEAVPVNTVLSKEKPERTKRKIVSVFGLYNDPVTARWLLVLHREALRNGWNIYGSNSLTESISSEQRVRKMPEMSARHIEELNELNWLARKPALLASYQGQSLIIANHVFASAVATATKKISSKAISGSGNATGSKVLGGNDENYVHTHNLVGRLRNQGFVELVRYVIQYI